MNDSSRGPDHPFSRYVRAVGRGAKLSVPLSEDEAAAAMDMILAGRVEPVQLGAFLVVLRYRKETPAELAGFVRAARGHVTDPAATGADIDWPSYADRHRQLPYFVLAALLLAGAGLRVLMHGIPGRGPATTPKALAALGIAPARSLGDAAACLDATGFAYLPLAACCRALERLFDLRRLLGVRSPANTFARALNPGEAPWQMQGVFHPTYLPTHRELAGLLGQPRAAIFKGGAGEVQRHPDKPARVVLLRDGAAVEETWPALTPASGHAWRDGPLDLARLAALWRGDWQAPAPEAAVIGTAAIALRLAGRATGMTEADEMAAALWAARPKAKYG